MTSKTTYWWTLCTFSDFFFINFIIFLNFVVTFYISLNNKRKYIIKTDLFYVNELKYTLHVALTSLPHYGTFVFVISNWLLRCKYQIPVSCQGLNIYFTIGPILFEIQWPLCINEHTESPIFWRETIHKLWDSYYNFL